MQCLFCGKELALLKRLRGGGEFCSEAHRREYQEQYEQLALARLLQAKPPGEHASAGRSPLGRRSTGLTDTPEPRPERSYQLESPYPEVTAQAQPEPQPETPVDAPSPVAIMETPASEESGPAPLAGFLSEPLVPAVTPFDQAGVLELDNEWERVTTPPSAPIAQAVAHGHLAPAPRVELALSLQALDHHTQISERGLELREFTGPAPVMELRLRPGTGSDPASDDDVVEVFMSPHPPQKAKAWLDVPRGFPVAPAELGDLARLDFATTGFAYSDGPVALEQAADLAPDLPQAPPQAFIEAPPQAPVYAEPSPEAFVAPAEPIAPTQLPLAEEKFAAEPVTAGSDFAEPDIAEPVPSEFVAPELVTKVLPVTLHGLAAGSGKLAQPFHSALASASDVQVPPSATLPLRPAIVFGPPPAPARTPETAPAESKQVPPKPAQSSPAATPPSPSQPVQSAPAQLKPAERVRSSVVPAPKPAAVQRPAAAEAPVQEKVEKKVPEKNSPKVSARPESPAAKPLESVPASEATMPSLHLETNQSAWSKLSTGLKIGVAVGLVVAISGIAYLVTRSSGKPPAEAPPAVASSPTVASGVAISGGWIDDWANAAKSRRHISVLSGSAKLSDYRLEFQAQIETKAIGWIFRGLNPRNYYVTKLEVVTPGLEPTVALVHFAVVDGQDEDRVVVPLPMKVRIDTTYKIRFEAFGNRFTTWIQDQKIAEWTDSRFGSGGVGFFSERDEKAAMQGTVNVVPLVPKN